MNLYEYVRGNPQRFVDPSGEIPLDTVLDAAFLLVDLYVGAGAATIAMDVAALLTPYVPNTATKVVGGVTLSAVKKADLVAVRKLDEALLKKRYATGFRDATKRLIDSEQFLAEQHRITSAGGDVFVPMARAELEAVANLEARSLNRATVQLEYVGWRTQPNEWNKHFPIRPLSENELRQTASRGRDSLWRYGVTNEDIKFWIQQAIDEVTGQGFSVSRSPVGLRGIDGHIYDTDSARQVQTLRGGRSRSGPKWIGVSNGKCTSLIKLKVEKNGQIHAFPYSP